MQDVLVYSSSLWSGSRKGHLLADLGNGRASVKVEWEPGDLTIEDASMANIAMIGKDITASQVREPVWCVAVEGKVVAPEPKPIPKPAEPVVSESVPEPEVLEEDEVGALRSKARSLGIKHVGVKSAERLAADIAEAESGEEEVVDE